MVKNGPACEYLCAYGLDKLEQQSWTEKTEKWAMALGRHWLSQNCIQSHAITWLARGSVLMHLPTWPQGHLFSVLLLFLHHIQYSIATREIEREVWGG